MHAYFGIVIAATAAITANILRICSGFGEALRLAAFQVASIITTTGYSTADFNLWPGFSKAVLFILMFIGGCASSTAGGLKVTRVVLLFKMIKTICAVCSIRAPSAACATRERPSIMPRSQR